MPQGPIGHADPMTGNEETVPAAIFVHRLARAARSGHPRKPTPRSGAAISVPRPSGGIIVRGTALLLVDRRLGGEH